MDYFCDTDNNINIKMSNLGPNNFMTRCIAMQNCEDLHHENVRYQHSVRYGRKAVALFEHQSSQSVHPIEFKYIESTLVT